MNTWNKVTVIFWINHVTLFCICVCFGRSGGYIIIMPKKSQLITVISYNLFTFQLKWIAMICVLLIMIECFTWIDANPNSHVSPWSVHSRQKRGSPDFFGKIKEVRQIRNVLFRGNVFIFYRGNVLYKFIRTYAQFEWKKNINAPIETYLPLQCYR